MDRLTIHHVTLKLIVLGLNSPKYFLLNRRKCVENAAVFRGERQNTYNLLTRQKRIANLFEGKFSNGKMKLK